jgi:glycosyltransferase involved in cell wall biosynthesis
MKTNIPESFELSIVIPCLNEEDTIASCILKARSAIEKHNLYAELIVADNGSTDRSVEIAEKAGARIVHVLEKGYGFSLMGGIRAARGRYILMGDADDSYDFSGIYPFVEKLREGYDLVVGCRFPKKGGTIMPRAMPWLHRYLGTPVLTFLNNVFFRSKISDVNCGLRGFSKKALFDMELQTTGMELASEMIIKAALKKMKITEIPITLYKDGRSRKPHLNSWRDGWRHLRFMLLFSPRWLFLIPGFVLLWLGAVFGGLLLRGALRINDVGFDTNSLLICSMSVLVGFQLMSFATLAKVYAISHGLLPPDPRINRLLERKSLEVGLIVGVVFIAIGFLLVLSEFLAWRQIQFGPLSYSTSLRIVIPAVTLITLGVEIVFNSFFLGVLNLPMRSSKDSYKSRD